MVFGKVFDLLCVKRAGNDLLAGLLAGLNEVKYLKHYYHERPYKGSTDEHDVLIVSRSNNNDDENDTKPTLGRLHKIMNKIMNIDVNKSNKTCTIEGRNN